MPHRFATFLALCLLVPSVVSADTITGRASVIDGDTLEVHGQRIRLHGIDAPESSQTCSMLRKLWRCGQQAALALDAKIASRPVACEPKDRDRYNRIVAVCHVGGDNLNAWLVTEGWALAYRQYSTDYVALEEAAAQSKVGMWRGEFMAPWEWRKSKRNAATRPAPTSMTQRPGECPIKGNISRNGRIYHVPGGEFYDRTRIDTTKGERWFCSEAEAQAAGWKRSRR